MYPPGSVGKSVIWGAPGSADDVERLGKSPVVDVAAEIEDVEDAEERFGR